MNINKQYIYFLNSKSIVFFPLFILLWSTSLFAMGPFSHDTKTEAGFLEGNCRGDCTKNNIIDNELKGITDYHQCLVKRNSKKCQEISEEERITCYLEGQGQSFKNLKKSGGQALISCIENLGYSFVFLFKLVLNAIQISASMIIDSEARQDSIDSVSSLKNYTVIEFYKAYEEAKGNNKVERLLQAAMSIGGSAFNKLWAGVSNFYEEQDETFSCYSWPIQSGLICSMVLGFVVPGGTIVNILKQGARGAKISLQATKKTKSVVKAAMENMKKKSTKALSATEIKKIAANLQSTIRNRILASTTNIPKNARTELTQFFNRLNPKSLKSNIEKAMKEKNLASPQFPTFITGVFMSNAGMVLSKESRRFIIKEIADVLATSYAKAHVRNSDFEYIFP